jgi:perosamine synthetase
MFFNHEVAYKYKMSSMQAALGLAQLERIEELLALKRKIFDWYGEHLSGFEAVTLNRHTPETDPVFWMVTVIVDPALNLPKERLMELMSDCNIDCRPFFHPLSSIPAYQGTAQAQEARSRNRVSYLLAPYGVNLPSGLNMTEEKVAYVCSKLKDILDQDARAGTDGVRKERVG